MAERFEDWTAGDDDLVRGALATLRHDVDALPLPDVRFVKARGVRRRRQRALALTAAAAAAAVVVGAVGFGQLGRDTGLPVLPATQSTGPTVTTPPAPAPTATTGSPTEQPGALPVVTDWTQTLNLTGSVQLSRVKPFGPIECLASEPGTMIQQEEVTRPPDLQGGQVRFRIAQGQDPETAAESIASDIAGCRLQPAYTVTPGTSTGFPRLYSYTAGDAGSGWWAVVPGAHDVVVLQVNQNDRPRTSVSEAQMSKLSDVASGRLARYGTGTSTGASGTSTPNVGPTGSTRAVSQDMPVSGPQPVPTSALFVAATQWRSQAFRADALTTAVRATDQSTGVIGCEDTQEQAGVGGTVGVVTIQAGTGKASLLGRQRVRVFSDVGADQLVAADIARTEGVAGKGCTTPDGVRTVSKAGPSKGTYLLTTASPGGTVRQWVGITAMTTPGAVSTIVFTGTSDGQGFTGRDDQGFAELDRLLMLARQK